jgi:hypothetical protein
MCKQEKKDAYLILGLLMGGLFVIMIAFFIALTQPIINYYQNLLNNYIILYLIFVYIFFLSLISYIFFIYKIINKYFWLQRRKLVNQYEGL